LILIAHPTTPGLLNWQLIKTTAHLESQSFLPQVAPLILESG